MTATLLLAGAIAGFYLGLLVMSLLVIGRLGDAPPPPPETPPIPEEKVW